MLQNNAMIPEIGKIADGESGLSLLQKIVVVGTGFEPVKAKPADLQSAPVDRLGILPPKKTWSV